MKNYQRKIVLFCLAIPLTFACGPNENKNQSSSGSILGLVNSVNENAKTVGADQMASSNASQRSQMEAAFAAENDGSFTFNDLVSFTSSDGTKITGNLFQPKAGGPYPAVIFVNSWALNEYEYIVPAAKLAKKGYVVLSYNTRGFGTSEGKINVAGPKDMEDLSSALDYLQRTASVNENIGIAGISYGAGISLLGVTKEPRIKTAVAMSGWGSLPDSLYGNQTPRLVWGLLLIASGYLTGNMDPIIAENFQKLLDNRDVQSVLNWAGDRSPSTFAQTLNATGKPVYISNNSQDNLFQPNQVLDYFQRLTVPKKLDLNNGIHATAEIGGILGIQNYIWTNAYDWFDYWLKGIPNGIMSKPMVSIQKRHVSDRVFYNSWPIRNQVNRTYHLKPMGMFNLSPGSISTTTNTSNTSNTVLAGATSASTGVPLLSEILDGAVSIPIKTNVHLIDRSNAMVYISDSLSTALKVRGKITYKGKINSAVSRPHFVVYLYEVDSWGTGTLITHGASTLSTVSGRDTDLILDLQAVAHDFPKGSRLGLAIDNVDPMYANPYPLLTYLNQFKYNSQSASTLTIQSE